MEKPELSQQQVVDEAQTRLNAFDPRIDFKILDGAVRQDEAWWYLPVVTYMHTGVPAPRDFAVSVLAKVEVDLHERYDLNVLFIPSSAA